MKKTVVYIHGKGGSPSEAEHYKAIFPDYDVVGLDYKSKTPWEAREEFPALLKEASGDSDEIILIANSIGAYFSLCAFSGRKDIYRAFFISPVVDMEKLILDMLENAGETEEDLREKKTIVAASGETLSWEYLEYVRENTPLWFVSTDVLCGENDNISDFETVSAFCKGARATLTVMKNGEHWFHTPRQMGFLDGWIIGRL